MATNATTPKAPATPKAPKVEIPLGKKFDDQITKAVIAGKMSEAELKVLAARLTRLHAFMAEE